MIHSYCNTDSNSFIFIKDLFLLIQDKIICVGENWQFNFPWKITCYWK